MTLATMKDPRKKHEIQKFLHYTNLSMEWDKTYSAVWLDGNDLATKGTYFWNDDELMSSLTSWYNGKPDNQDGKNCVSLLNFELFKQYCTLLNYYLCERK